MRRGADAGPIAALTFDGNEWRGPREPRLRAALAADARERRRSGAVASTHRRRVAGVEARHALTDGRERRKALCRAFAEKHVVAEVDTDDFARCHVLLRRRVDRTLICACCG